MSVEVEGITTSTGFLALLDDEEYDLQEYALKALNQTVDQFWPEIADEVEKIERLYEDESFKSRELAALVVSKVFYHLGQLSDAMQFALSAGSLFSLEEDNEYVVTLVSKCVEEYGRIKKSNAIKISDARTIAVVRGVPFKEESVAIEPIDPRLEAIVERLFARCLEDKEFKQCIGVAVESLRLDVVEKAVKVSDDPKGMLQYIFDIAMDLIINRDFRTQMLTMLVRLYQESAVPDYVNMSRSLVFLNQPQAIVAIFETLLGHKNEESELLAFQIAFELVDNATQQFINAVRALLPQVKEDDAEAQSSPIGLLQRVLSGQPTLQIYLEFLYSKSKSDLALLKKIKDSFEPRHAVLHQATIVANAFMHSGTTRDTFLRDNLDWLSKATNWAKFTTTASLGALHKGHLKEAMNVLDQYLPKPGIDASPYTEGGSLFGLGLIHANQGANTVTNYILQCLRNVDQDESAASANSNPKPGELDELQKKEIVQHGAALGLGVAAMASGLEDAFEELMNLLYHHDSAVAGEAAGLALGLVMLGSATERATEMLNFAHVTQHEKIIRSVGLGLALLYYALEEKADPMIESMCGDKDPVLRYGGMFCVGLAYVGTANNRAIQRLLHVAVSDVNDDVRRAAVMNLGFVMFKRSDQVPELISLLAESYNAHVRYGSAMALGIACAGSGLPDAVKLLETLAKDPVHYVRQGAYIALGMVLIEISERANPKVKEIRKLLLDAVQDKHQPQPAKFGAILGLGILDAGGRNVTIALSSRSGHINLCGVVGIAIFLQYWYWYPFQLFLTLAFSPTAIIGVTRNLEMPTFSIKSNARPSLFAYPEVIDVAKEEEVKPLKKAELSVTRKANLRAARIKAAKEAGTLTASMEIEIAKEEEDKKKEEEEKKKREEEERKKREQEATFEILQNPARVTRSQRKYITFDADTRFKPVTEEAHGIVVLRDLTPAEQIDLVKANVPVTGGGDDFTGEPEPPAPFEFLG